MIIPMKKVALIVEAKDGESAVRGIRSLGVLHVEHQTPPAGKDIASLKDDISILDKVVAILLAPELADKSGLATLKLLKDWRFTAKHILDTYARIDHLVEYSASLRARIEEYRIWGDFDPEAAAQLRGRGVHIGLYLVPAGEVGTLRKEHAVTTVAVEKGIAYCAVVSAASLELPYRQVVFPKTGLNEMRMRLGDNEDILRSLKETLRKYTCAAGRFIEIRKAFARELVFHEAIKGMGSAGTLVYIVGYAPSEKAAGLEDFARKNRLALSVSEPSEDDRVPTFVRTPRWVSIIAPVFRLIEIVPGYRELDISPVFLLALSLFFGMIIGDAGYGALYITLTFFAQKKFGRKLKDHKVFFLFYLFSASAVMWGLLTGNVFGQEWYLKAGMKPIAPILNDTKFLQAFCFFIGAVHLSLAHAWQGLRKLPSLTVLADVGWISVIWAAFFLACMLILGQALPACTRWLIIGGVTLVVIGTSPQRNILKMIGNGLANVALSIMNNFTDVVSYVRLFAVGLAGVAIADTVNTLAAEAGNPVAQVLILFAGHTINIILGPMSVLVHGVRLNVLEFSGHAGLTWSGVRYKPLED